MVISDTETLNKTGNFFLALLLTKMLPHTHICVTPELPLTQVRSQPAPGMYSAHRWELEQALGIFIQSKIPGLDQAAYHQPVLS